MSGGADDVELPEVKQSNDRESFATWAKQPKVVSPKEIRTKYILILFCLYCVALLSTMWYQCGVKSAKIDDEFSSLESCARCMDFAAEDRDDFYLPMCDEDLLRFTITNTATGENRIDYGFNSTDITLEASEVISSTFVYEDAISSDAFDDETVGVHGEITLYEASGMNTIFVGFLVFCLSFIWWAGDESNSMLWEEFEITTVAWGIFVWVPIFFLIAELHIPVEKTFDGVDCLIVSIGYKNNDQLTTWFGIFWIAFFIGVTIFCMLLCLEFQMAVCVACVGFVVCGMCTTVILSFAFMVLAKRHTSDMLVLTILFCIKVIVLVVMVFRAYQRHKATDATN